MKPKKPDDSSDYLALAKELINPTNPLPKPRNHIDKRLKDAAFLIKTLRHMECGLSGPCRGRSLGMVISVIDAEYCTLAGQWLDGEYLDEN